MKSTRRSFSPQPLVSHAASFVCGRYFFHEKSSGALRFHVEADSSGQFPVDWAAGMLAVDCLIRGQVPDDYVVTTPVAESQLGSLRDDAEKLLAVGRSLPNQVGLTRRERDVLEALLHNLTNKEISVALGLTERTVKFHVSSLLAKFKVCNRQELVQKALNQVLEALPKLVPSGSLEDRYGSGPLPSGLNAPRSATSQERVQRQAVAPR